MHSKSFYFSFYHHNMNIRRTTEGNPLPNKQIIITLCACIYIFIANKSSRLCPQHLFISFVSTRKSVKTQNCKESYNKDLRRLELIYHKCHSTLKQKLVGLFSLKTKMQAQSPPQKTRGNQGGIKIGFVQQLPLLCYSFSFQEVQLQQVLFELAEMFSEQTMVSAFR